MPTAMLGGSTVHYIDQGRGASIVLLHAFPVDSRMWGEQIEALSGCYRVIAPDFRGFGLSSATDAFTIDMLADDVHALASHLDAGCFTLAGLSMGGYVALAFAKKYSSSLRGLILLDTKADADTADGREGREKMIQVAREKGSTAVGEAMQSKLLSADTIRNKPHIVKQLRTMTDSTSARTIELALAAMRDRPDQTETLAKLQIPTLVSCGEDDAVTPPSVSAAMQQKIPHAELVIIQGAGHMTAMEQPAQVSAIIRRFLDRV